MVEQLNFLGAGEQARLMGDRLARRDDGGLDRVIGLEAATGAAPERGGDVGRLRRDERRQPIFSGTAEPAARRGEALVGFRDDVLLEIGRALGWDSCVPTLTTPMVVCALKNN